MNIRFFTWIFVLAFGSIAFSIAYLGSRATVSASAGRQLPPQAEDIPSPTEFVAISVVTKVTDNGRVSHTRFWRNSAGSTRYEASSPDGSETVVTIHNYQRRLSYSRIPNGSWAMLPMELPSDRQSRPKRMKVNTPGLSLSTTPGPLGFEVYQYVSRGGAKSYLAPDLNFYPLLSESPGGRREEVIKIDRAQPANDLFEPPPGVPVRTATDTQDLLKVHRQ
jgi:hypothetical protein